MCTHIYVFLICVIVCVSDPQATITIGRDYSTTATAILEESVDAATAPMPQGQLPRPLHPSHDHHTPTGENHPALRALQTTVDIFVYGFFISHLVTVSHLKS